VGREIVRAGEMSGRIRPRGNVLHSDGRRFWNYVTKFARRQHPAIWHGARFVVPTNLHRHSVQMQARLVCDACDVSAVAIFISTVTSAGKSR